MKSIALAFAVALATTAAVAQTSTPAASSNPPGATSNAPMPGVNPNTGTPPGTGMTDRNTGAAAASGDRNQAVTTTNTHAPQPARGSNSFTMGQARGRIEKSGIQKVAGLHKDNGGVWRGLGMKDGRQVNVWVDYKGNVGEQ
jgi:hypothetical protein